MRIDHWEDNKDEVVIRYPEEQGDSFGSIFTYWVDGRFEPFLPHFDEAVYIFYKFR